MTEQFRAIDTKYRGFLFRSRLEARWAVFFDALGMGFRYEPEGFEFVGHDRYLPDFYLPRLRLWVEVKPQPPTDRARRLANLLCRATGQDVAVVIGPPEIPGTIVHEPLSAIIWKPVPDADHDTWHDDQYWWCICRYCGEVGLEFNGRSGRMACCDPRRENSNDKDYSFDHPRLLDAVATSRAARFDGRDPWTWKVEP